MVETGKSKAGNMEGEAQKEKPMGYPEELNRLASRGLVEALLATVGKPLVLLDQSLRFKWANASFFRAFQLRPEETQDVLVYTVGGGRFDSPGLRRALEQVLSGQVRVHELKTDHHFQDSGRRPLLVSAAPISTEEGLQGILVALEDIAEQELMGERRQAGNRVRPVTAPQRRWTEDQLRLYAAHLECSNRELEDFAYIASHDLQEPLRKIQAFGDRLQAKYGEMLGEEGRDYLERMRGAAGRMQTLIKALLAYSRVSTRCQPFTAVSLAEVMQEVISNLEARLEETAGQVEVGYLPVIEADPSQMVQLLQNLVVNALKFHREGLAPLVKVFARVTRPEPEHIFGLSPMELCRIYVEDNGIGFNHKYLERIFLPFQRLHGRGRYEGTGIGLAICRKIAERHGGTITASSTAGQGSTFIVTLPMRQDREARQLR